MLNVYMCNVCKIYTPGTMGNSQTDRAPTEINKNGSVVKIRVLVEQGIL